MTIPHLPARYDHVGSFLRPQYLLEAREKKATGQITAEQLRLVEDQAITEIVKFQEDVGLKSITDGEFRRTYFHIDFLEQLGGVKTDIPVTVRKPDGTEELAPPVIRVIDKVRHAKDIQLADFQYLKSQVSAGRTPKVSIPSPTMLHFRGGRAGISKEAYPELDPAFYDDVARAYGDELRSLAAAGCTYVQMDDTNLAYLCDEKMREAARQRGDDPNELPHRYAQFVNKVVAQKPAGMTLAMHLCRGNFKSTHAAAGQLRARRRGAAEGNGHRRLLPGIRRRPQRRLPSPALPAQGQDGGAGPGDHQVRHAGEQGRPQAPHRRGRPVRAAGPAGPLTAMRFQQHRARQQHRG
jgi:5-methyltetrahydropteroyltriglutamate--homocysteine methyltransferase